MNNCKKLLAALMSLAMVATVAPVKVDAEIAGPTVCTETNEKFVNTVADYVDSLADVVDLETVKADEEFAFGGDNYATIAKVLEVSHRWGRVAENNITLQDALNILVKKGCATEEMIHLAGYEVNVPALEKVITDEYGYAFDEDVMGYLTDAYVDEILEGKYSNTDKTGAYDDAKEYLALLANTKNNLTNPDAALKNELPYLGNMPEDVQDMVDEILEAVDEYSEIVAEAFDIDVANEYVKSLMGYLTENHASLLKTTVVNRPTVSSTTTTVIDPVDLNWNAATGRRTGTTYELETLVSKIENDKAGLTGSYEDNEDNEDVVEIMDALYALIETSEELDALAEEAADLEILTKVGKENAEAAKVGKKAENTYYAKSTTWAEVLADSDFNTLYAQLNVEEYEAMAEAVEFIEDNFVVAAYNEKGSRWVDAWEYTELYPNMWKVLAAAGIEVEKGAAILGLFDHYYDNVNKEWTGLTNWEVLAAHIEEVAADYETVTTGVKGITVNNLTAKNVEKVIAAYEAAERLTKAAGNLTTAENNAVTKAKPNIGVLYIKALFNGDTTVTVTGWVDLGNGNWDYYDEEGKAVTGWVAAGSDWYYVKNGHMLRNSWIAKDATGAVWYYVGNDGAMVSNTVVDGYTINANGEWVK